MRVFLLHSTARRLSFDSRRGTDSRWGPLLGPDRAFDPTRFFIFCGNVLGSPYGTASSVTLDPSTSKPYGPEMPISSVKDDVRLHYQILRQLGVASVAAVIGGSMGGMTCLEYPLNTPPGFVQAIIPLATSARHSAWCISWGEAQRQSIYSDPDYRDGYYYELEGGVVDLRRQPARGLAAARMAALLTYRSRDSFESRFGRRAGLGGKAKVPKGGVRIMGGVETTDPFVPGEADLAHGAAAQQADDRVRAWREHNDGHRSQGPAASRRGSQSSKAGSEGSADGTPAAGTPLTEQPIPGQTGVENGGRATKLGTGGERPQKIFSAQSYLRYQGDKVSSAFCILKERRVELSTVYRPIRCQLLHPHHAKTRHARLITPIHLLTPHPYPPSFQLCSIL